MIKTNQRKEYRKSELLEESVRPDPIEQFDSWYKEAVSSEIVEPNAMNLATCGSSGQPTSRIVLLREFSREGFIFYTNYDSAKGRDLAENRYASICFYWDHLERQVRIEAEVSKLPRKKSEQYFFNRPRKAQLSAYVSNQSKVIDNREALERRFIEAEKEFEGSDVPFPESWGGYLAKPSKIEFWQGREGRLHDRLVYLTSETGNWQVKRLFP